MTIPNPFDGYPWIEFWIWAVLVCAVVAALVGLFLIVMLTAMAILGLGERLRATLRARRAPKGFRPTISGPWLSSGPVFPPDKRWRP